MMRREVGQVTGLVVFYWRQNMDEAGRCRSRPRAMEPASDWPKVDGCAVITRSLTQTQTGLEFKGTKTEKPRPVVLPESAVTALAAHRQ
jgi:hypothetical protein